MIPSPRNTILPDTYLMGLLTALALTSLFSRPLLPIDETRYVTVAWEMWQRGDFLVPYLNGEPYSHKPPLLFWLIHAGWSMFGVNEWWPRLIAPIFGLGTLALTRRLSMCLWPDGQRDIGTNASFVLLGSILWTFFSTLVMFDMLVAFFALACIYGLVSTFHSNSYRGWIMVVAGMGLGILAKGPVILKIFLTRPASPWNLSARIWANILQFLPDIHPHCHWIQARQDDSTAVNGKHTDVFSAGIRPFPRTGARPP